MKPYGFIYITTNKVNNKKYIGQHKILNNSLDDAYLGSGTYLTNAIKKYGRDNFHREIIKYANSEEELNELEEYYISKHDATKSKDYYNIHAGGKGGSKFAGWSEKRLNRFKAEQSKRMAGEGNPRFGVKMDDSTKDKIRQARFDNPAPYKTEEFIEKMKIVTSGENNGMYGRKHSEESKKKMSENRKGLTSGEKNGNYGNIGDKAKNGKAVYKYADKEHTKLIKRYNTMTQVLNDLNMKGHRGLMKAIKNNEEYKDYYWGR